jgi:hypothetical protein
MPPAQQQAYINQQIMAGNIDYLSALALKGQYDRLKNSQQQQPPNTTIVGGMQAALATGNPNAAPIPAPNSLLSPQQGIAQPMKAQLQPPQPQPQQGFGQPQPQGGIPTVPVPALDDADYSMARGGIVAFAGGSTVPGADFYVDAEGNIRQGVRGGALTAPAQAAELLTPDEMAKKFDDIRKTKSSRWTKGLPQSWQNVLNRPVGGVGSLPSASTIRGAAVDMYLPALAGKTLWEGAGSYRDLYNQVRLPEGENVEAEYDADDARRMFGMKTSNDVDYDAIKQADYGNYFFTDPQFWRDYGTNLLGTGADIFSLGLFQPRKEETAAPKKKEEGDKFEVAPALPPGIGGPERTEVGYTPPKVDESRIRGVYKPTLDFFTQQEAELKNKVRTPEAHAGEYQKMLDARGIGATSKKRQAEVVKELTELPSERRRAAWLNAAAGFFEAAGETAQGKSLGASWATGAATGLKGYRADVKDLKAREDRLKDAQANLEMADEAVQMGIINRGDADYKAAKAEYLAAQQGVAQTQTSANTAVASAGQERDKLIAQVAVARIQANRDSLTPLDKAMKPWFEAYNYYQQRGDVVNAEKAYKQLVQLAKTDPRIIAIAAGMPQVPGKGGTNANVEVVGVRPEGK